MLSTQSRGAKRTRAPAPSSASLTQKPRRSKTKWRRKGGGCPKGIPGYFGNQVYLSLASEAMLWWCCSDRAEEGPGTKAPGSPRLRLCLRPQPPGQASRHEEQGTPDSSHQGCLASAVNPSTTRGSYPAFRSSAVPVCEVLGSEHTAGPATAGRNSDARKAGAL